MWIIFNAAPQRKLHCRCTYQQKIRGLGFALACDALKELGYQGYAKPDSHMIEIFNKLGFCSKSPVDAFETKLEMSDVLDVSPFKLDKTLWLVCSGKFYLDEKRAKNGKAVLLSRVKKGRLNTEMQHRCMHRCSNNIPPLPYNLLAHGFRPGGEEVWPGNRKTANHRSKGSCCHGSFTRSECSQDRQVHRR